MAAAADSYVPGWTGDAVRMMSARGAADRAGTALALLCDGDRVLDVGCGPGTITLGLAAAVAPNGTVVGIDAEASQVAAARADRQAGATARAMAPAHFLVASAYALPRPAGSVDLYFSHALFEHLADPDRALAEAWRVLAPGAVAVLVASDWSRARFDPETPDVATTVTAYRALRRRAGGDPDAGGRLADRAAAAGLTVEAVNDEQRVDMGYAAIAAYIGTRLADAGESEPALAAARRWQQTDGHWTQCWTEVVARKN